MQRCEWIFQIQCAERKKMDFKVHVPCNQEGGYLSKGDRVEVGPNESENQGRFYSTASQGKVCPRADCKVISGENVTCALRSTNSLIWDPEVSFLKAMFKWTASVFWLCWSSVFLNAWEMLQGIPESFRRLSLHAFACTSPSLALLRTLSLALSSLPLAYLLAGCST